MSDLKNEILDYAQAQYGSKPEYLWEKTPDCAVLRHWDNKKWFAIFMNIPKAKLGLESSGNIDIINLKCDTLMVGSFIQNKGYFKAYHMNKEHWITIALDGTVPQAEIQGLLDVSFELTKKKVKRLKLNEK